MLYHHPLFLSTVVFLGIQETTGCAAVEQFPHLGFFPSDLRTTTDPSKLVASLITYEEPAEDCKSRHCQPISSEDVLIDAESGLVSPRSHPRAPAILGTPETTSWDKEYFFSIGDLPPTNANFYLFSKSTSDITFFGPENFVRTVTLLDIDETTDERKPASEVHTRGFFFVALHRIYFFYATSESGRLHVAIVNLDGTDSLEFIRMSLRFEDGLRVSRFVYEDAQLVQYQSRNSCSGEAYLHYTETDVRYIYGRYIDQESASETGDKTIIDAISPSHQSAFVLHNDNDYVDMNGVHRVEVLIKSTIREISLSTGSVVRTIELNFDGLEPSPSPVPEPSPRPVFDPAVFDSMHETLPPSPS